MNEHLWKSLRNILGDQVDLLRLKYELAVQQGKIILEPPQRNAEGEFYLGEIQHYDFLNDKTITKPFSISREELNKHILILGETGAGKTNLNYLLLSQILKQNEIKSLIFDFKQDYRHLIKQHNNLAVIRWPDFRFNPLSLPFQEFCDVFCQDSSLLLGSKGFLLEALFRLNRKNPTAIELLQFLNQKRVYGREAQYLDVVRNRIKTMILEFGDVINCSEGILIEDLINKNIVLELDGLGKEMQDFLINILLRAVFLYRIKKNERGILKHLIVIDEAKRIFDVNKERRPVEGIPTIDILTSQIREFGEGLIITDQESSKLTDSIKANSYCKIIFHLGSGKDIEDISKSIGLTEKTFLGKLNTGHAIVKIGNENPFLLKVPYQYITKDVSNEMIGNKTDNSKNYLDK